MEEIQNKLINAFKEFYPKKCKKKDFRNALKSKNLLVNNSIGLNVLDEKFIEGFKKLSASKEGFRGFSTPCNNKQQDIFEVRSSNCGKYFMMVDFCENYATALLYKKI